MISPKAVLKEFFQRSDDEEKRLTAEELFADDAVITRPGERFEGPQAVAEFFACSAERFDWASKRVDQWIEADNWVVSIGRLYGADHDGNSFSDVRYVDVAHVTDGEIQELHIYNDLATDGIVSTEDNRST